MLIGIPFFDLPDQITSVVGGIGTLAGFGFALWRGRQMKRLIKESFEVVTKYRAAKKDGTLSPEEVEMLIKEIEDVALAGVDVWKFWRKSKK